MKVLTFIACPTLEYSHIRSYLEQFVWYHTVGLNSKFPPAEAGQKCHRLQYRKGFKPRALSICCKLYKIYFVF